MIKNKKSVSKLIELHRYKNKKGYIKSKYI